MSLTDKAGSRGWLTLHEVLEETQLPYRQVMDLAERGLIATRPSGAAVLYDPDDVNLVARVPPRA